MLTYNIRWRVAPPADGRYINSRVPDEAVGAFYDLASHSAPGADREEVLWRFKSGFAPLTGRQHARRSSSLDYARSDLREFMQEAAGRPPQFLEVYEAVCVELRGQYGPDGVPGAGLINQLCVEHNLGYRIEGARLLLREDAAVEVVAVAPRRLLDEARDEVRESLARSEELLQGGRGREAVQEVLWLLESISTAFQRVNVQGHVIEGTYFVQIIGNLRRAADGRVLQRVLGWLENIYGYLSAPGGGGVRHGAMLDLDAMQIHEATLFVNLIRSFVNYLLSEYERLPGDN